MPQNYHTRKAELIERGKHPNILLFSRAQYCAWVLTERVQALRTPLFTKVQCGAAKVWVRACWLCTVRTALPTDTECVCGRACVSPAQRTACVTVVIPPQVDNGNSSYPLIKRLRMAANLFQTVTFCGCTVSSRPLPNPQPKAREPWR